MRWNTPRSNGWIGSTTAASSSQSVMCHQWSSKRSTIVSNPVWPSRPDLNPELSGDPGAIHSIRSERLLCEQLDYNLLFRWFVGLSIDEPIWDHSSFTKNRDRLIEAKI